MADFIDDIAVGKLEDLNYNSTQNEFKSVQDRVKEMKEYFEYQFFRDVEELFGEYMVN